MSALPQRKKTPEELAKLREEHGMPSPPPAAPAEPAAPPSAPAPSPAGPTLPQRKKNPQELAALRDEMGMPAPPPAAPPASEPADQPEPPRPAPAVKKVRSLKRSERRQRPEPIAVVGNEAALASHRHSKRELEAMRLREAMRVQSLETPPAILQLKALTAHPVVVILGYVLALAGPGAFPVALYIAIKKPRSRHHAGFMTVIALFATFFGVLHYFPNLQPIHGS